MYSSTAVIGVAVYIQARVPLDASAHRLCCAQSSSDSKQSSHRPARTQQSLVEHSSPSTCDVPASPLAIRNNPLVLLGHQPRLVAPHNNVAQPGVVMGWWLKGMRRTKTATMARRQPAGQGDLPGPCVPAVKHDAVAEILALCDTKAIQNGLAASPKAVYVQHLSNGGKNAYHYCTPILSQARLDLAAHCHAGRCHVVSQP